MTTIFVHRNGRTEQASSIERAWLSPTSGVSLWIELAAPSIPDFLILSETFAFHPLAVEDARSARQFPKIEAYDGYLYVVLHEITPAGVSPLETHEVHCFVGPHFLVTVHDGTSDALADLREHVTRNPRLLGEGSVSLFHRVLDALVDRYRPEMDRFEERLDAIEETLFDDPQPALGRRILEARRQVASLRRVVAPQRDVVGRLARRDFVDISTEMSFRFRDVHDHLIRVAEDALLCQDRVAGMLDAHLSHVNARLNAAVKALTVVATILMPATLLATLLARNGAVPRFPGGESAQLWGPFVVIGGLMAVLLAVLRRNR